MQQEVRVLKGQVDGLEYSFQARLLRSRKLPGKIKKMLDTFVKQLTIREMRLDKQKLK